MTPREKEILDLEEKSIRMSLEMALHRLREAVHAAELWSKDPRGLPSLKGLHAAAFDVESDSMTLARVMSWRKRLG